MPPVHCIPTKNRNIYFYYLAKLPNVRLFSVFLKKKKRSNLPSYSVAINGNFFFCCPLTYVEIFKNIFFLKKINVCIYYAIVIIIRPGKHIHG